MKVSAFRSAFLLLAVAALLPGSVRADTDEDPPGRVARLGYVSGQVSLRPAEADEWTVATLNRPLTTGDQLWTDEKSRAELQLGSAVVRASERTSVDVLNLDDQTVQLRVPRGTIEVTVRRLADDESFELSTPAGAVSLRGPGRYRVDVAADGTDTTIHVRRGDAVVAAGGSEISVVKGKRALVAEGEPPVYDVGDLGASDAWDDWADERDTREEKSVSLAYVSPDVPGAADLDAHGDWSTDESYGPVWRPRNVVTGWAPYRYGHWAWIDPWGWTWVDDASWGFAPFHYGRWVYARGGWGWAPGTIVARPFYAPHFVAFAGGGGWNAGVGTGGVGWWPLAPGEVWLPAYRTSHGYNRRVNLTSVNVSRVDFGNVNVSHVVYANRVVPGGMTSVRRDVFTGARPIGAAAVVVSSRLAAQAAFAGMTAPIAPRAESLALRPMNRSVRVAAPPQAILVRPVQARLVAPPAPVPFSARQSALRESAGRPLDRAAVTRLQSSSEPRAVVRPVVTSEHATLRPKREGLPEARPVHAYAKESGPNSKGTGSRTSGSERGVVRSGPPAHATISPPTRFEKGANRRERQEMRREDRRESSSKVEPKSERSTERTQEKRSETRVERPAERPAERRVEKAPEKKVEKPPPPKKVEKPDKKRDH